MEGIHDGMHFVQLRRARFFGHGRTSDCADEQIFRRVAQVNKFQQLSLITHAVSRLPRIASVVSAAIRSCTIP